VSRTYRRHFLKEKDATRVLQELSQRLKVNVQQLFGSKPKVESVETQIAKFFFINGKPTIAESNGSVLPILSSTEVLSRLPKVVVNMGAVPHVCNGAAVMAPGVVQIEGDFDKSDLVLVVDERHSKPLAIGVALTDSQAMRSLRKGKILENVHYVGDKLWNQLKVFSRF